MSIYKTLFLSSLLLMGFAVNVQAQRVSSTSNYDTLSQVFSTDSSNADTVPHRGSGR
ncbi:hypothetical protein NEA10_19050 [Phormidium yuhuli AB48]|uniref:Uncharacterized protein n=1 Tax=Phormidium yuhuli AB48 TaxID=2940671 RepID=A0ABY5APR9_9CYAN|nr:hypothetical protein [Phormidium yuhuli]USR90893.1 hypothetical protein NEA10_19050 [Phormidium yuhuli AB48]